MIDKRETRETIIEIRRKGRSIRVERVQQWRAGFDLSYEVFVNDERTQENLKPDDVIRYLGSAIEDGT